MKGTKMGIKGQVTAKPRKIHHCFIGITHLKPSLEVPFDGDL
jgi:hypothetical protein